MDGSCSRPGSTTALFSSPIPVILISHVPCNVLIKSHHITTLINFRINLKMEAACFSVMFMSTYNTARCQNSKTHYEQTIINDMFITSCKNVVTAKWNWGKGRNYENLIVFLITKANEIHYFSDLFYKVLYMFWTGPLSIIRSISTLYTQQ